MYIADVSLRKPLKQDIDGDDATPEPSVIFIQDY